MRNNARVALNRINLRDSFVMRETVEIFVSHLTQFVQTNPAQGAEIEAAAFESLEATYGFGPSRGEDRKPFVYQDGFAIIPIHGALLNRFGGSWGFVTGYQAIRRQLNAALEDEDVKVIVFDVDSPGGEAAGCFELSDEIRAARDQKPLLSVVDSMAASAAYALASAATRMMATPSSKIGSIGVIAMHIDISKALEQEGVKVTLIEAPEDGFKTAGSPFKPLSEEAQKKFQASVNRTYDDFSALIVKNRGLSDTEVRETKAWVFRADEALALRLIDAVKTPSEAVSSFMAELADDEPIESEDEDMKAPGSEATSAAPVTPAPAAPAAEAPAPAAPAAVPSADIQAALKEDRERMAGIKALPEAVKRPKLADKLAVDGLSVEQAKGILGAAAEETAAAPVVDPAAPVVDNKNHLDEAMDKSKHPEVGAGPGSGDAPIGEQTPETLSAQILADQGQLTGRNYGEPAKQPAAA